MFCEVFPGISGGAFLGSKYELFPASFSFCNFLFCAGSFFCIFSSLLTRIGGPLAVLLGVLLGFFCFLFFLYVGGESSARLAEDSAFGLGLGGGRDWPCPFALAPRRMLILPW